MAIPGIIWIRKAYCCLSFSINFRYFTKNSNVFFVIVYLMWIIFNEMKLQAITDDVSVTVENFEYCCGSVNLIIASPHSNCILSNSHSWLMLFSSFCCVNLFYKCCCCYCGISFLSFERFDPLPPPSIPFIDKSVLIWCLGISTHPCICE